MANLFTSITPVCRVRSLMTLLLVLVEMRQTRVVFFSVTAVWKLILLTEFDRRTVDYIHGSFDLNFLQTVIGSSPMFSTINEVNTLTRDSRISQKLSSMSVTILYWNVQWLLVELPKLPIHVSMRTNRKAFEDVWDI